MSAGEVFGFLGPNGAGKTTTVRMLCTLLPPTAGSASVAGLDVVEDAPEVRRRIGVALQEIGLDPVQTGRELLELQCGLYGITGQRARTRAEELLELVGLTDAAERRTKTYSGGMKRRLDLATALVHAPDVLFLDEPTTGLDPASRLTIWDEVRRINEGGATVFLTTQYLEEADKLCDRLAIIDNGQIVAEGTPEQLKAEMGHDVVSVSVEGADIAATESALSGLPGLERVLAAADGLALYVDDGPGQIAEIVRRLEREEIRTGAISVARPIARRRVPQGDRPATRGPGVDPASDGGEAVTEVLLLGRRATREIVRYPEATIPTLFIPLFFLVVNIGQVSKTFPSSTPFLKGQGYVAFQLPVSLMFAVATATSGLALVTEIELGYFDKLLVAPIRRSSIIFGRLTADLVRGIATSALVLLVGIALGARIASGVAGALVIILLSAGFGVAYAGFGLLVALRTRNVQATQSSFLLFFPLLFLTPNFVPFNRLSPLMETLARLNPVSYVIVGLRSLVIDGWDLGKIAVAALVIVGLGIVLTGLSLRVIATYDR